MKLRTVEYDPNDNDWKNTDYLPSNSRYILVHSPEFGTSIGFFKRSGTSEGEFKDSIRITEKVNIIYWRELPRYYEHTNSL